MISILTPQQKDDYLNQLLIFMKDAIEQHGVSVYNNIQFRFQKGFSANESFDENIYDCAGEDRIEFLSKTNITDEEFDIILNFAITHRFIESLYAGNSLEAIVITDDGMDRAMSVERATYKPAVADSTSITFNGPVNATNLQAGNNNVQNINNTFYYLIDEIKKSEASDEEKKTALIKLKNFLSNPIVSGITSGCTVEILKYLAGMGI